MLALSFTNDRQTIYNEMIITVSAFSFWDTPWFRFKFFRDRLFMISDCCFCVGYLVRFGMKRNTANTLHNNL